MAWKLFDKLTFKDDPNLEAGMKLAGYWILKSVGGKPPPLALHVFHYKAGGTWESESILLHKGGGHVEIRGEGIWKIQDGILKYTAGENSGETIAFAEGNFLALEIDRETKTLFAANDGRVYVSRDNGNTWQNASLGLPRRPHCSDLRYVKQPNGERYLYLSTYGRSVWRARL